ncbi:MAG TPA: TonB-dependent receptor [Steroidobacteraceae bacterium]|jgi:iron complex outermembrane receptor protein|nr:TonB-dependent receptor [Steroidobacteraceae bacterium]
MHPRNRNCAARAVAAAPTLMMPAAASRIGLAVAAALATCAVAPRAHADDAAAAADVAPGGLQEVVVTARKRSENLQDVPLSIDVLTQKDVQNLGIVQFEDYATKVPSISFISVGPGTQTFFMRGVSDGSNPNYANTSATGFFLDDSSLSWFGVEPDLHLYDIERIEVLNGPQGTTFGASSMAGAIRYITNKPDVNAFGGGADFDGGKIQGGQENWTYEGFVNIPLIEGTLGFRASAFSASNGGFITNELTTRTWVNGTVSNNAEWARDGYNREHQEGMRAALKWVLNDKWSALFSYDYQRMSSDGAWDEDPGTPDTVERFGPQALSNEDKIAQFHLDGDVGIADLVFASTYWSLPTRRWDEYSQYMQNYLGGAQEGFTCLNDPVYGTGPYSGCKVPLQYYEYHTNPERWSDELRLVSKEGGRFHWLVGTYWEKTRDKNSGSTYFMPGLQTGGAAFQYENAYYGTTGSSLPPGQWYSYNTRSDYLQTTEFANISYDITSKLNVEAGEVHFHSDFKYYSPYGQFAYDPVTPSLSEGSSHKWDSKLGVNYKLTDTAMVYADWAQGFRDGGANSGDPQGCYANGVPQQYIPDTLNNYELGWKTTWLNNRLLWNGATYLMYWKNLQTIIYDINICPSASFYANVGEARIYGAESNVDYKVSENWSFQGSVSYTDSHLISSQYETFEAEVGERLPYVPYFSWSGNLRYEHPLSGQLNGYWQWDIAHKGDMWDDLHVAGSNGFPRMLQPEYSIMNLRLGMNPPAGQWLAEFYITNLTDKNAIIYTNTGNFDLRQTTNQPRTFGVRLSYRFGKQSQ